MGRLPVVSGRECIRALGRLGYTVVRQKGSHVRLTAVGRNPVSVPLHDELDRGTLQAILRATDVTPETFITLLER